MAKTPRALCIQIYFGSTMNVCVIGISHLDPKFLYVTVHLICNVGYMDIEISSDFPLHCLCMFLLSLDYIQNAITALSKTI